MRRLLLRGSGSVQEPGSTAHKFLKAAFHDNDKSVFVLRSRRARYATAQYFAFWQFWPLLQPRWCGQGVPRALHPGAKRDARSASRHPVMSGRTAHMRFSAVETASIVLALEDKAMALVQAGELIEAEKLLELVDRIRQRGRLAHLH